jgi:hypothetical protein
MKKIIGLIVLVFAVLSFTPISYGQMKASDRYPTLESAPQIAWIATKPSPSLSPLGVAPALMFPSCKSPSGLVLLMVATYEQGSYVTGRNPSSPLPSVDTNTPHQKMHPQTLVVYPLTKDGPAQQPCTIQEAKSSIYEPVPGSLLSAFPIA